MTMLCLLYHFNKERFCLGAIHKRRSQSGKEVGLSSADKGVLVRTFWCKKHRFFEIYGVSARTTGVEPVRKFFRQVGSGSQFFCDFVRTSYGQLLMSFARLGTWAITTGKLLRHKTGKEALLACLHVQKLSSPFGGLTFSSQSELFKRLWLGEKPALQKLNFYFGHVSTNRL